MGRNYKCEWQRHVDIQLETINSLVRRVFFCPLKIFEFLPRLRCVIMTRPDDFTDPCHFYWVVRCTMVDLARKRIPWNAQLPVSTFLFIRKNGQGQWDLFKHRVLQSSSKTAQCINVARYISLCVAFSEDWGYSEILSSDLVHYHIVVHWHIISEWFIIGPIEIASLLPLWLRFRILSAREEIIKIKTFTKQRQ